MNQLDNYLHAWSIGAISVLFGVCGWYKGKGFFAPFVFVGAKYERQCTSVTVEKSANTKLYKYG